jgi:succinate dehydrogenase / fumarate reductase cytochrome b subunit
MAGSGLLLCLFLLVHLIGNISLLLKDDGSLTASPGAPDAGSHFMAVVGAYGKIPALLYAMEIALASLFLLHIGLGLTLWWQNRRARGGQRYEVQRWQGGRTLGSATMPWTGACVILTFLVIHLVHFRFGPQTGPESMYLLVDMVLTRWVWALVYVFALLGLMLHLSHGVQSAFQSLGLQHERWTPKVQKIGWGYALLMLAGFGVLPVLYFLKAVTA